MPDFTATKNGKSIAVECKRLVAARAETWVQNLSMAVIGDIGASAELSPQGIDVEFDHGLADLSFEGKNAWNDGIVREIAARIYAAVQSSARTQDTEHRVTLTGIGEIRIQPSGSSLSGSIGGVPLSRHTLVRRMVRNAIVDARGQLTPDRIGVVAIFTLFPPPLELLDVVLRGLQRAEPDVLGSIGVVLVLPPTSLFEHLPPLIWTNPRWEGNDILDQVVNEMAGALAQRDS